ncbi:hypothetical protein OUHCRE11_14260 [Enterobacter asburiae]
MRLPDAIKSILWALNKSASIPLVLETLITSEHEERLSNFSRALLIDIAGY